MILKTPKKILKFSQHHKILSFIILIALLGGSVLIYKKISNKNSAIRYVTGTAEKGSLIVSISGTGQVSASNQVDLKPKASGDVIYVGVKNGQEIKAGALIAQIDSRDAQKSVRDAEATLENAKISLEKFKLANSKNKLNDNLKDSYDDGYNDVSNAFLDLPDVMTGLHDILLNNNLNSVQSNLSYYTDAIKEYNIRALQYKDETYDAYQKAQKEHDQNFEDYKSITRSSDATRLESLINQTYNTAKTVSETIKSVNNFIQFYKTTLTDRNIKYNPGADPAISTLNSYTSKVNNHISSLSAVKQTLADRKDAFINSDLDLKSQELSLKQKETALADTKEKLNDYYIRAPFSGAIAKLNVKKYDSISGSAAIATLITDQKIAELSLNEIDAAKVKISQQATLTFDAIPDITLTGKVIDVDAIGTASQGVVTYTVKISFDTQDSRIKTAMSVSASIIVDVRPDVLLVSNSAIKSQNSSSYVELIDDNNQTSASTSIFGNTINNPPRRQTIETGASNDEFTEIISGLNENDAVITRTIQPDQAQPTINQQSSVRIPGLQTGGGGGGSFRAR